MSDLNRRDAIRRLAIGGTAAATLPLWVENLLAIAHVHAEQEPVRQAAANWAPKVLSASQNEALVALAEAIIPETDTPGAKGARVNEYIDEVLATAKPDDRKRFVDGLEWLDRHSRERHQRAFAALTADEQAALLTPLSESPAHPGSDQAGVEFFRAARAMTIAGYYTSAVGILQEIGEPEGLFFAEFKGCTHAEHQ